MRLSQNQTANSLREATHLIDGGWVESDNVRAVYDPGVAAGPDAQVGRVHWGGATEAAFACDAAARAEESWGLRTARYRADILLHAAELLDERSEAIALTLAYETGKRLPEAQAEVAFSGEYLRWFAEEARRGSGSVLQPEAEGRRHLVIRRPSGVVFVATPWNFPVSIPARKIAAALAAGCTIVVRVSEQAPLAATGFIRVLHDAGIPAGVINLVHGPSREITNAVLEHAATRVVSFTGSTSVGCAIMAKAAERMIRPVLELGGNAPFIVFADADLDAAVEGAVLARLRNAGQSCVAANRFYAHHTVIDEFGERFAARLDEHSIGHGVPEEDGPVPDLGPLISAARVAEVGALVSDALDKGARVLTKRGEKPEHGSYFAPVLLRDATSNSRIRQEEVFGPAAALTAFGSDEEAIDLANASQLGLASYMWTQDPARVFSLTERIQAGIVGVNDPLPSVAFAPMGGVKASGIGREGGDHGREEFEDVRTVAWRP